MILLDAAVVWREAGPDEGEVLEGRVARSNFLVIVSLRLDDGDACEYFERF